MPIKECEGNHSVIWDSVAACFTQKGTQIPNYLPGKENYDIVWPFLFQVLQSQLSKEQSVSKKICDFGCGTGIFAEKMHQIGFDVFACDISTEMISLACSSTQGGVTYEVGSLEFMQKYSTYAMVTSIMVFQFIMNFESAIKVIDKCLVEKGILFFAIHTTEYVNECLKHGIKFRAKKNLELPTEGEILIGNKWIKTYIRSAEWYDDILCSRGFTRLGYSLEGISAPFHSTDSTINWKSAKYYIAWYRKGS